MEHTPLGEDTVRRLADGMARLRANIEKVFVGKPQTVDAVVTGFAAGLHCLIEDVPGVGKTTLCRSLAASVGLDFSRIQFTPDLLPGDIVGMTVWSPETREFLYKQGAIMHQFILADEINRASPRTQSSLLEAMQEGTVSVDGRTYRLPEPFFVIATQNPSDFIGAFHLPEGELDRFGISVSIGYPTEAEEREILGRFRGADPLPGLSPVVTPEDAAAFRAAVGRVFVSAALEGYIIEIANRTRSSRYIRLGASPRACLHLQTAAQARALAAGRSFVVPEDILTMSRAVLPHRLVLSAEARIEGVDARGAVERLVAEVRVPTGVP